ncbi:hypothetical protein Y1Q_0015213 [Alligator mississippiensis]|uniref:Uncharacterized protein n=1 Tax=Alligator mississippiensis TaxID=8496 RepID=A0A151P104_ALLMI|nr:hypothetical protein Y1Q_0015213 [Alligator mississippiensis]
MAAAPCPGTGGRSPVAAVSSLLGVLAPGLTSPLHASDDDDDDDDDDKGSWLPAPEAGSVGAQTPGSKIRSFFGLWYRGSSSSDASRPGSAAAWEIIDSQDVCAEQDGSEPAAHSPAEPASE